MDSKSCTKALMPLVSAPLAVLWIVLAHLLVTLFEVVISNVNSQIKNGRFHPFDICTIEPLWENWYCLSWISNKRKEEKVRNENLINDWLKELQKGANSTRKRTVSGIVNGSCTILSNVFWGSDFECNSHIKNGCFHQFDICTIERTS